MKNYSIWEDTKINTPNNFTEKKEIKTDILIIGGGITGLTLAYFLKDSKEKVTLIDKSQIAKGVTSKTTAKITYLQKDIYQKIKNKKNRKLYYQSQKEAIELINKIITENNIECDFKKTPSIIFTNKNKNIKKIVKEYNILKQYHENPIYIKDKNIKYGIAVCNTYTFHPLKYLRELINKINKNTSIYENVLAKNITKEKNFYKITTNKYPIYAKKVVVACHYPFFIIPTIIPIKTYVKKEYVNASKIETPKNYSAINIDNQLHSIRFYKDYIIYGSNDHYTTNLTKQKNSFQKSINDFKSIFKKKPEYSWINQDIMSNDNIPFIGKIKENMYLATAYNAWGMTNSTIAAKIIYDLINKRKNKYTKLFNPKRINTKLIINSTLHSFHYLKSFIIAPFKKNNPYYVKIKGITYGIYKDETGMKHKVKLICPHMKCPLIFNKEEKTWDCPCHGSRYDIDGNIIEGPTTKSVNCNEKSNILQKNIDN